MIDHPETTSIVIPTGPLAVVVVNYGSHELLAANLVGLSGDPQVVRVVVVDNLSTTAARAAVFTLAHERGWDLITQPDNRGFGTAANAGAAFAADAGCTSLLFLNPDASIDLDTSVAMAAHLAVHPRALVSPVIRNLGGAVVFEGSRLNLRNGDLGVAAEGVPWLGGACLAVSTAFFTELGGFAPDYFLYWEDVDLSVRALRAGGEITVRSDLTAVHDEGGTQGRQRGRAKSDRYYFYNCRNRLLFAAALLDRRELWRWCLHTPRASWRILLRGGRRQLVHSPRPLLSAFFGTGAGLYLAFQALLQGRHRPDPREIHRGEPTTGGRTGESAELPQVGVLVAHPGSELYGSDRVMLASVVAFIAAGLPVTVALPSDGPLVAVLRAAGARVEFVPMPVLRKSALSPSGAVRLFRDLIAGLRLSWRLVGEATGGGLYVSTLTLPSWLLLGRLRRRTVVCHVHEAEGSARWWLRRGLAQPLRLAHRVVFNSRFSLQVVAGPSRTLRRRSEVVYNCVPGPAQVSPPRAGLDPPLRLLYVGRLSPRKGPQLAIAMLAQLRSRGVDASLDLLGAVFTGYEWFQAQLEEEVAGLDLTDRVRFLGFRSNIWPYLADADIALVPSLTDEPFGNTAVEAVLAARPAVVSDTTGLREAAAGYRSVVTLSAVGPEAAEAWADAVQRIMADWSRLRDAAVADAGTAARRHSADTYATALLQAMRLASGHRS